MILQQFVMPDILRITDSCFPVRKRNAVLLPYGDIMVCEENGTRYSKNGRIIFTGTGQIPCPLCGGKLHVRGTCTRKLRGKDGTRLYRLRVMKCDDCGKTHRELPPEAIPYRRLDTESISEIAQTPEKQHLEHTETSTWRRICAWIDWFLRYVQTALETAYDIDFPISKENLAALVRALVNSGKWIQHRLV